MKAFLFIVLIALLLLIVFVMRPRNLPDTAIHPTNAPVVVHWLHINLGTNSATKAVAIGLKSDGSVMWALPQ